MSTTPNQLATTSAPPSGLAFVEAATQTFEGIERLANLMAKMGTMPAHLQGKPADCFRVVVQAAKWRMDPFAVAECTSLVHGRMCFEGKLVAAVLQSLGAIEGRLTYVITGKGQNAEIAVTGTPKGGEPVTLHGSVRDWRTNGNGSPWDKQPETQLVYRGTRQWARMYAPEALLGVYTPDEFDGTTVDVTSTATVHPATPEEARIAGTVETKPIETKPDPAKADDKPAPQVHPALAAGNALYESLNKHQKGLGGKIIARLSSLNGAKAPKDILPEYLDQFGKDVAAIAALGTDLDKIDHTIAEWEAAQKGGN